VNEDGHQREGVRRQVVELMVVVLKQREGGEWQRKPSHGVGGEEDKFIGLQAIELNRSTLHPPIKL
jgi:hypothetical protein